MNHIIWPMPEVSGVYIYDADGNARPYDSVFSPDFFHELIALMRIEPDAVTLQGLRIGHASAVSAFMAANFALASRKTLKQGNKYLEAIAFHADKLGQLLVELPGYPTAGQRLVSEIEHAPLSLPDLRYCGWQTRPRRTLGPVSP